MSFTASEEIRIQAIERKLNDIQVALNRLATRKEMKALATVRQQEIIELQAEVDTLQSQVQTLQSA